MHEMDEHSAQILLQAMVRQAAWDVLHSKPGSYVRIEAENFFRSAWFEMLTGLDGNLILQKLLAEYDKKHPPKERRA